MIFRRGIDGSDPSRTNPVAGSIREEHEATRTSHLASGTLACPCCDAPVALAAPTVSPADALTCPFCDHAASVRDFLSLGAPTRPTRVDLRVVHRARGAAR